LKTEHLPIKDISLITRGERNSI